MGLIADVGRGPAALDTVAFIYFIEEHPDYLEVIAPVFEAADGGRLEIRSSALAILEVLVVPYRNGDMALGERYEMLLTRSRGVRLLDISRAQLRAAAQLRAVHRVRTPDALQLAAALSVHSTAFITNDRELPEIPGLRILQLRDYV
jgi:predicted nucleic acid-binding protein